ncbi:PilW family protein, partial [Marinospirillum sp.]|uniref:PilW family protein n=1 Tax=Marinospirillum sp. TaxID=2183934 RepID=UPI003A86A7E6
SRNGVTEELVTGIQSMRIHYGEGANQVDTYVRANSVNDWDDVRAIRIQLIAVGEPTNISDGSQSHRLFNYNSANQDIALPGNRIGQSFVTTVALRNRVR